MDMMFINDNRREYFKILSITLTVDKTNTYIYITLNYKPIPRNSYLDITPVDVKILTMLYLNSSSIQNFTELEENKDIIPNSLKFIFKMKYPKIYNILFKTESIDNTNYSFHYINLLTELGKSNVRSDKVVIGDISNPLLNELILRLKWYSRFPENKILVKKMTIGEIHSLTRVLMGDNDYFYK